MRSRVSRHALLIASVASLPFAAHAEEAANVDSGGQQASVQRGLEEIVVTAQRREESLQDVPVAVTAISSAALDQMRITSVRGLDALSPSLQINTQAQQSNPTITIRGVASGTSNNAVDPKVGIYIDGVYVGRTVGSLFDMADIERVEVLRGPQGTLFGRNATSGAISLVSAKPTGEWGGKATVSYGKYDAFRAKMSLDLPSFGPFSVRLAYLHDEIEGDVKNLIGGKTIDLRFRDPNFKKFRFVDKLGGRNVDGGQIAVHGDFGNLTADYRFDYSDVHSSARAVQSFGVVPDATGPLLSTIVALQPMFGGITNISTKRLRSVANATSEEHVVTQGHSLTFNLAANDNLSVKSITAYRKFRQDPSIYDLGSTGGLRFSAAQLGALLIGDVGGIFDPANAPGPNDTLMSLLTSRSTRQKQFSQEFQAQVTTDAFNLTAGVFYFHENTPATDILGVFQPVINGVVYPIPSLDSAFGSGVTRNRAINDSMAGYGQITFHLTDTFDLTGGLRYTIDDRETILTSITGASGGVLGLGSHKASYSKLNYTAIATWKPTNKLTAYGKIASGYVAGGILSAIPYKPETLTAYEVGVKADMFDNRLRANLAAYYSDYKDLQTAVFENGVQIFQNAGKADIKGFEAELQALPVTGLVLSANVGYTDFKYKKYITNGINRADDARPVFQGKWTMRLSGQYDAPEFSFGGHAMARVDASYKSKQRLTAFPIVDQSTGLISPLDALAYNPAYWMVDGRIGVVDVPVGGTKLSLSAFGQNLFNEKPYPFGSTVFQLVTLFDRGRTYGVELGLAF